MAKDFIKTWDGRRLEDWGCVVSKEFKQFQSAFKREVKRLAEERGANLVGYSNGHYDMCGFVERNGKYVYFSYGSLDRTKVSLTPNGNWHSAFLMRTAKSAKDYHGGTNNHVAFSQFQEIMERLFQQQQSAAATQEQTITIEKTNQQSNQTTNNMEANNIKAADLIGKTIIVGEGIATIVIKSADGETLQGEFKKSGSSIGMQLPITIENLKQQLDAGSWKIDGFAGATGAIVEEEDAPNEQSEEPINEETADDPVLKQWQEAKSRHPESVIIFRNGDVCVVIGDDADKVAAAAGLKTAKHGDTTICVFPHADMDAMLPKVIRAGYRVAIEDLQVEPTNNAEDGEEQKPQPKTKHRVQPRSARVEEPEEDNVQDELNGEDNELVAEEPVAEQPSMQSHKKSEITVEPEEGKAFIREVGKSIIVAGDTSKIEAVLLTLWGRKRPYTHKGKIYCGIQMSSKHKKTVQEIIKLAC